MAQDNLLLSWLLFCFLHIDSGYLSSGKYGMLSNGTKDFCLKTRLSCSWNSDQGYIKFCQGVVGVNISSNHHQLLPATWL